MAVEYRNGYGFYPLNHRSGEDKTELVAVHGIGGGCVSTWKHITTQQTWLYDMLPHDLQPYGTRIWTYGYNSQIAFSGHVTNISDLANSLLGLVRNNNVGKDGRKIVWVCHSLGGLVVKKALLNAAISRNDPYMQLLLSQTAGIIFLGTPHQGSDVATFAYQVAKITVSGNKPLLRALKANCPALFDDVQSFHQISEGMKIYSFYETMETYGLGIVVPRWSAVLVGSTEIPLATHHTGLCRYRDRRDQRYLSVLGVIKNILETYGENLGVNVQGYQSFHLAPPPPPPPPPRPPLAPPPTPDANPPAIPPKINYVDASTTRAPIAKIYNYRQPYAEDDDSDDQSSSAGVLLDETTRPVSVSSIKSTATATSTVSAEERRPAPYSHTYKSGSSATNLNAPPPRYTASRTQAPTSGARSPSVPSPKPQAARAAQAPAPTPTASMGPNMPVYREATVAKELTGYLCDACGGIIPPETIRMHCLDCKNFDLHVHCYRAGLTGTTASDNHSILHDMQAIDLTTILSTSTLHDVSDLVNPHQTSGRSVPNIYIDPATNFRYIQLYGPSVNGPSHVRYLAFDAVRPGKYKGTMFLGFRINKFLPGDSGTAGSLFNLDLGKLKITSGVPRNVSQFHSTALPYETYGSLGPSLFQSGVVSQCSLTVPGETMSNAKEWTTEVALHGGTMTAAGLVKETFIEVKEGQMFGVLFQWSDVNEMVNPNLHGALLEMYVQGFRMERLRNGLSSVQNPWAQEIYDLLAIRKLQEERRIREQKEREQRAAEGLLAGALLMSLMLD